MKAVDKTSFVAQLTGAGHDLSFLEGEEAEAAAKKAAGRPGDRPAPRPPLKR